MKLVVGTLAAAFLLAAGAGFTATAQDAETANVCPPASSTLTQDCASQVCTSVADAANLDVADQALVGRNAAALIRDFGDTDPASSAVIEACIASGPNAVFVAYQGSEVAQVGESVPASEQ